MAISQGRVLTGCATAASGQPSVGADSCRYANDNDVTPCAVGQVHRIVETPVATSQDRAHNRVRLSSLKVSPPVVPIGYANDNE